LLLEAAVHGAGRLTEGKTEQHEASEEEQRLTELAGTEKLWREAAEGADQRCRHAQHRPATDLVRKHAEAMIATTQISAAMPSMMRKRTGSAVVKS
jgi:hypothetical protein